MELCRLILPDDISYLDPSSVNGLNLYCYCLNNPIMYIDSDGHVALWILALVGIVVPGAVSGVINVMTKSENDSAMGAFIGFFLKEL